MITIRHVHQSICCLALLLAPGTFAAEAVGDGDAAINAPAPVAPPAPSTSPSETELLRAQVALQQRQIEQLRNTLELQQRQLDQIARAIPGNPDRVEVASLTPVSVSGPLARASATIRTPYWTASTAAMPQVSAAGGGPPVSTALGAAPAAAAIVAPRKQGPGIIPHSHEQEHAEVRQPKKWYEKYSFRGYTQLRHNRLVQTNDNLICFQCDGSTANNNNFIFRRARFVLSGEVSDKISIYFQPDFAVTNTNLHFAQLRDLYMDIALDQKREFRFRVGQSKVPFSFDNLQSSQNRIPLDRNDSTNTSFANERDLGVFFYWAPAHIRARFNELLTKGLKGSGDYGVLGTGLYNGQILNSPEQNNDLHYSWRATYPWKLANGQFVEASIQAYTGKYTVATRTAATRGTPGFRYNDRRAAASLIIYPQPFGLQTEWNVGTGPEYNRITRTIDQKGLAGGYLQLMYMRRWSNGAILTPFYRYVNYAGGKKQELDARHYIVKDNELGFEWQPNHYLELVMLYARGSRIFEDAARPNWRQTGHQLRVQLQVNY